MHAIVIGGGIAGLLTACALADQVDRITLVERDFLPTGPQQRRGVPQACHVHGLLVRGRQLIELLLPGFTDDLTEHGAVSFDFCSEFALLTPYGWATRPPGSLTGISASRDLIEWIIRRRVLRLPNLVVWCGQCRTSPPAFSSEPSSTP